MPPFHIRVLLSTETEEQKKRVGLGTRLNFCCQFDAATPVVTVPVSVLSSPHGMRTPCYMHSQMCLHLQILQVASKVCMYIGMKLFFESVAKQA